MEYQPYLIFELNQSRYGVLAPAVQELFFRVEITPIAEAPPYMLGVINLRGEILPVMDLHRALGQPSPPCQLSDSIIVLQDQQRRIGVVVNQVHDVQSIDVDQVTSAVLAPQSQQSLMTGIAKLNDGLVMLLDPARLIQLTSWVNLAAENLDAVEYAIASDNNAFDQYAHLSPQQRQTLKDRAANLRQKTNQQDATDLLPLAVMGLGGEYFGMGLEAVYEFTNIHHITPVPCCPSHIVGNMNLRGEVITLVDVSSLLHLSAAPQPEQRKAIIVRLNQLVAGITVDEIYDVVYIHPSQVAPVPVAMRSTNDEYLQGVVTYGDRMMSIVNLPKVLTSGALVVNEEV